MRDVARLAKVEGLTAIDKWRVFQRWVAEGHRAAGAETLWNVRRLLYEIDGTMLSGIELMVSDVVGSAFDGRRGNADPKHCQVEGSGLTRAVQGAEASFQINASNSKGIRFDDGGDPWHVHIRMAGRGTRLRAKVS